MSFHARKAMTYTSTNTNPNPYIPASLSEINDMLGTMPGEIPKFIDKSGYFPELNIDSRFHQIVEGFGRVRKKLGEDRYATLIDLAARAKSLFLEDPEEENGMTREGRNLIFEMQDVLRDARARRVKAKLPDEDGEITGD
jgi:hypothetical protein